jgi:histone-lysine N-methyltransferase SETMAR
VWVASLLFFRIGIWVPRMLTVEMKASRFEVCQQLLSRYEEEGEEFLHSIVTAEETWVHHYEPESKTQSMEHHQKVSLAKKKFKTQASARKLMATVFLGCRWFHSLVLPWIWDHHSLRALHCNTQIFEINIKKGSEAQEKNILLQYDKARTHTSWATTQAIEKLDITILAHTTYSPDFVPCVFHRFPKMKEDLCGYLQDLDEEAERAVRTESAEFFPQ